MSYPDEFGFVTVQKPHLLLQVTTSPLDSTSRFFQAEGPGVVAIIQFAKCQDILWQLTHQENVQEFLPGIGTDCSPDTRRFLIGQDENGGWWARLGRGTRVWLSDDEAQDLCEAVDEVFLLDQKQQLCP